MVLVKNKTAFLIFILFLAAYSEAETPHLTIEFPNQDRLRISYAFAEPTTQLAFKRNPDKSRALRWELLSEEFQFLSKDGQEYISRKDLSPFDYLEIEISAAYTYLPADYAPFQPFSDGGLLFHSGRFFACSKQCSDGDDIWRITAIPSPDSFFILSGEKHDSSTTWEDGGDGTNIYHGSSLAVESSRLVAVVDSGLPSPLKVSLETAFPKYLAYFAENIGEVVNKPMLFASYGRTGNGWSGRQGGALPNQVFMHWYGDNLEELISEEGFLQDTNWFFAHEAGHIYQQRTTQIYSMDHPWIHEGFAEIFAQQAMLADSSDNKEYTDLVLKKANEECLLGLSVLPLVQAASGNNFQLNYSCGFMIHSLVDNELLENSSGFDIFDVWRLYHEAIESGAEPGEIAYFGVVLSLTSEKFVQEIKETIL